MGVHSAVGEEENKSQGSLGEVKNEKSLNIPSDKEKFMARRRRPSRKKKPKIRKRRTGWWPF